MRTWVFLVGIASVCMACDDTNEDESININWETVHECLPSYTLGYTHVESLAIEDDTLQIGVSYGGGCKRDLHRFGLCYSGEWDESSPIQVEFNVLHDANGDYCMAILEDTLTFDLDPFKTAYERAYKSESGSAIFVFDHCSREDGTLGHCDILYEWFGTAAKEDCGPPIGEKCPPFVLSVAPDTWIEHQSECGFSFRAPDDMKEVDVQGVDSCVSQFENEYCTISADSGASLNALNHIKEEDESRHLGQATIDDMQAKIVTATITNEEGSQSYVAAAHFPNPFGSKQDISDGIAAEMYIACDFPEVRDAMLSVLGTIRFD